MWTLLVRLESKDADYRIAHLRLVWFRLLRSIDYNKGIQWRAYGISINYVNIIQVSVN